MSPKLKTVIGFSIALAAAIWLATRMPAAPVAPLSAVQPRTPTTTAAPEIGAAKRATEQAPAQTSTRKAFGPDVGFRSYDLLAEHYRKHGREFPGASVDDYLRLAQQMRDQPVSPSVLEVVRSDGVVTRFDRDFGVFIAFNKDGTIRTFFRPSDGESYFRRQIERAR